ncbi:hypothetical protein ACFYWY_37210 [Streptomyces sp. NPDC002870]|uniref:hypothetical protein n=1 Tax=Streptomyces sp. NPDC002870 TaxID=3364666 RepID=UPI003682518C
MTPRMSNKEAALRCIEDSSFAQKVIYGGEDYPVVRDAILADLYASTAAVGTRTEEEGFRLFDDKFRDMRPTAGPMGPCFVKYYPKGPKPKLWDEWLELPKPNLKILTEGAS